MTGQQFTTTDVLRLEIEDTPTGLVNLVQNPSGELGGWGWVTPVAGTVLVRHASGWLEYTSPSPAAASYFYTEPLPIAAGLYAAASWYAVPGASYTGWYRVKIEWLDASLAVLSSTAQTGYLQASTSTQAYGPYQAPASTAYCRLRFDHYSSNAGANPTAGQKMAVQEVTVAKAATSGALGTLRTNLVTNPSFEVNTTGWAFADNGVRVTTQAFVGTASVSVWANTAGPASSAVFPSGSYLAVTPGADYAAQAQVRAETVAGPCRVFFAWYKADGSQSATPYTYGTEVTSSTTAWTQVSLVATAPGDATQARLWVSCHPNPGTAKHFIDAVMVEKSSTVGPYFDGATADAGGVDYAWTGTAHASTSTATSSNLAFIEPVAYLNVLGPTHEIRVTREALNVGTLSATILDSTIDPSQADLIRPGKRVRLLANTGTTWEPLFAGKADKASVAYELLADQESKRARITLSAVDPVSPLAGTSRTEGVAAIADLPYVLEGCGVPWNCNGSGNQVPTATVVAVNENASALDQVAITRDSKLGYCWVDRHGVLQAWDAAALLTADPVTELRRNRAINPGAETAVTGWNSNDGSKWPVTLETGVDRISGAGCARVIRTATGLDTQAASINITGVGTASTFAVTPGESLSMTLDVKPQATGREAYFYIQYRKADNSSLSQSPPAVVQTPAGVVTRVGVTNHTVPALAVWAYLVVLVRQASGGGAVTAGETVWFDNFLGGPSGAYFSGDTPDAFPIEYQWTGTPNASESTEVTRADATLDETSYNPDLSIDYNTEACINEVRLKYLRLNPSTGESEEIPYGPYRNQTSIDTWGVRSAEFTIQGITEDSATLTAYANAILTANATPVVRINSVTLPIASTADLAPSRALLDLYDLVTVSNDRAGLTENSRITGIEHTITPDKWLAKIGFSVDGSVASPQFTPSPTPGASGKTIGQLLRPVGEVTMFYGAKADIPAGWLPCDGTTFSSATYPDLATLLGGTTLPDFTDRFPIGAGTKAKGTTGGAATKTIGTANLPPHTHTIDVGGSTPGTANVVMQRSSGSVVATISTPVGTGPGTSTPLDVLNPWRALWFVIRAV